MTSAPSQSSGQPADKKAASQRQTRRLQILAALEIDVWAQRSTAPAVDVSTETAEPVAAHSPAEVPVRKLPAGAGPAEALALLEASSRSGVVREEPSVPAPAGDGEVLPVETLANDWSQPTAGVAQRVDLLCLSGSHGLLLTRYEGLGPQAQRLLQDILQSATRAIATRLTAAAAADESVKPARIKLTSLRFTWPPEVQGDGSGVNGAITASVSGGESAGDTARALRGFLSRQLKGASEPVLLYVDDQLAPLLDDIELPVDRKRRVPLGSPDALMSDSSAKRALWRTLSTL